MYRIMLADDEGIVIDSLKFILEKEFGNECIIEFAKTGRSVIELAEKFRPDIAVMDIQMPGINGIEAMKEIRKHNENVVFIVMSAYDRFDYAKEAIKLGVLEYITKPMDKKRIISTIKKAMEKVDSERDRRSNDLLIMEKLETVVPIIENGLVYNILLQEHFTEDVENYKSLLGIYKNYFYMLALVYGDEQDGNHMTNAVGSSVRMQKYYQDVRVCFKEYFNCAVGAIMANKIAILVPYDKPFMEYSERIEVIGKTRDLIRYMKKRIDCSFRIGIGPCGELKDMAKSYMDALNALAITTGSVAHVDDLSLNCEYDTDYPVELEKKLFENVESGDINSAIASAHSFFNWMIGSYTDSFDNIKLKVLEFVLWAERIAYEKGGMVYSFGVRNDYLPTVNKFNDFDELLTWFVDKISVACRNVISSHSTKENSIIDQAVLYINKNYNKDISLADVSREVNISPYYFSKVFKDEMGENFIEYLTNIRIEKAKDLIKNSECSMKEICVMVGYSEPNYFSRSFKKKVGVTPTEYKEGKTANETL